VTTSEAPGATTASSGSLALVTTIDQVLASASNGLLLFVLAQAATVAEFGAISLLVAVLFTWVGFNRGALGTPILLVSKLSRREVEVESGYAFSWTVVTSISAAAAVFVIGVALGQTSIAVVLALAAPIVLVQDVLRYPPIAFGRPVIAVVSDGVWALFMLGLLVLNLSGRTVSVDVALLVWGLGGAVSAALLVLLSTIRPKYHRLAAWWRTYSPARIRFGGTYATMPLTAAVTTAAITAFAGLAPVAAIRGAVALFGPVTLLIMAVPTVYLMHVRRSGASPRAQWRLLVRVSAGMSALTLLATALLSAIPGEVGTLLLGEVWEPAVAVAPFVGLQCVGLCWTTTIYAYLQAEGMGRILFRLRTLHIVIQVGFCIVTAMLLPSAPAIAAAFAAGDCVMAVIATVVASRTVSDRRHDAPA
jgi:O-antigen/teichoic acid export membrane protein